MQTMQKPQKMQIDSIKCKCVAEANEQKKMIWKIKIISMKKMKDLRDMKSLRLVSRKKERKIFDYINDRQVKAGIKKRI